MCELIEEMEGMIKRKGLCLVMAAAMLGLTACGTDSGSSGDAGANANAAPEDVLKDGNKTELTVVFPGGTSSPASLDEVEAQINEIVGAYMDATVNLKIMEWGVFNDQQNLILSSGEDVALVFTVNSSRNFANSNQVLDITDLCKTYAKDALEEFGIYADACKIDGKLYGLPTFHEYTNNAGLVCRTDLLTELGVKPEDVKTWDDIENILAKAKEAYPEMNILCPVETTSGILAYYNTGVFDELCDTLGVNVYIDDEKAQVVNYYDTPEFMELAQKAYDWNQKGYVMEDATTITNTRSELLAAGNTFGYVGMIHPGTETQELKNAGVEVTALPVNTTALTTNKVNFAQYMVPSACSTPEKAVKLLDLMLTNKDISNLLSYGLEGKDYVVKDSEKGIVGYPDGVDSSSVGWNNETWLAGNGSLAYVWESDPETIWDDYKTFNESAKLSPLYGFTFDTSNVKTAITAMTNVVSKYRAVICSGYSDPAEAVASMVSELEAAGMSEVISEAQAQIDEWLAAKQ